MKRPWAYVASFVPFTTATSTAESSIVTPDELSRMRSKNDTPEEEDKKSSGDQSGEGQDGKSPNAQTPSEAAANDAAHGDQGGGQAYGGGHPGTPLPDLDASMYSAAGGQAPAVEHAGPMPHYGGGGGGGGSVVVQQAMTQTGTPLPGTTPEPGVLPEDDTGLVDSDPADADAMMILLGGAAAGSGYGAESSGEVDFEIVDYGPVTIGYGYAIYSASGSEGATADTYADVTGADLVFTYNVDHTGWNGDYSATYVIAIDLEEGAYAGVADPDAAYWSQYLAQSPYAQWVDDGEADVSVDGNTALLTLFTDVQDADQGLTADSSTVAIDGLGSIATASAQSGQATLSLNGEAWGVDTLASADGSLLEVEDHFSSVSGAVTVIA